MAIAPPGPPLADGLYRAPQVQNPWATEIQQLAAQVGGGGNPLAGYVPPAPQVPAGTYMGAYAAQGLRTTDPHAAAQLWESRHPGQVTAGNIPGWVTQGMMQPFQNIGQGADPNAGGVPHGFGPGGAVTGDGGAVHQRLTDAINYHRAENGLPHHQPEEIHARVSKLAQELLHGRQNRLKQSLRRIRPQAPAPTPMPPTGPTFAAS